MKTSIAKKLLQVQDEISPIEKKATNPFFNSSYFDINQLLAVVKPVLSKHGLILLQPLTTVDGKPAISTVLMDDDGENISWDTVLPTAKNAQDLGSIITYVRRYSLQSLLGLEAVDDDAESSMSRKTKAKPKPVVAKTKINLETF